MVRGSYYIVIYKFLLITSYMSYTCTGFANKTIKKISTSLFIIWSSRIVNYIMEPNGNSNYHRIFKL